MTTLLWIAGSLVFLLISVGLGFDLWRTSRKLGSDWQREFRDFEDR